MKPSWILIVAGSTGIAGAIGCGNAVEPPSETSPRATTSSPSNLVECEIKHPSFDLPDTVAASRWTFARVRVRQVLPPGSSSYETGSVYRPRTELEFVDMVADVELASTPVPKSIPLRMYPRVREYDRDEKIVSDGSLLLGRKVAPIMSVGSRWAVLVGPDPLEPSRWRVHDVAALTQDSRLTRSMFGSAEGEPVARVIESLRGRREARLLADSRARAGLISEPTSAGVVR